MNGTSMFTGAIVTSSGGAGTTTLIRNLVAAGVRTNNQWDQDMLKVMLPGCRGFGKLRQSAAGESPVILFLYDEPAAAILALAEKGWLGLQARKLVGTRRALCPSLLDPQYAMPKESCIAQKAVRHMQMATGTEQGCPAACVPPVPPTTSQEGLQMMSARRKRLPSRFSHSRGATKSASSATGFSG